MGMNIATVNLYSPISNQDQFFTLWKLSRVIKSTGWVYKASTDGTGASGNKETAGAFLQDMWGPGGIFDGHVQLGSQTGTSAAISVVTNNQVTLTGLTGMTASSVGHSLTLSGATNAVNNGTFTIVSFISSSSVNIFNANPGVVEATSLTWSERVSGTGTITWSSLTAAREQTITGLSGMTTRAAGHYLYLTGASNSTNNGVFQILKYVSATSVVIINASGVSETASGNWTELDPLSDTYPQTTLVTGGGTGGAWTVYQGPSTLKIPISASSTGTFIKGENISQSGSNAQGELIGYQYDVPTATGFLVVMPRQDGYGVGVHGWNTSASTITGTSSAATVPTANGAIPIEFVREIVLGKNGTINAGGTIWSQVVDSVGESTSRFTFLLSATGCTNLIPPGGGGTNNGFPVPGTMAIRGAGGLATGTNLFTTGQTVIGRASIFAANASYTNLSSADGTWTAIMGLPGNGANQGVSFCGFGFWRVDNNEDGDVDPYVWFVPGAVNSYGQNRVNGASPSGLDQFSMNGIGTNTWLLGWRRRGFATADGFQQFQFATLGLATTGSGPLITTSTSSDAKPDTVATSINTANPVDTRIRDPIWAVSAQVTVGIAGQAFGKMRKGTLRWGFYTAGFASCCAFDNKKWVQLSNALGPVTLGPWDGVSPLYCS